MGDSKEAFLIFFEIQDYIKLLKEGEDIFDLLLEEITHIGNILLNKKLMLTQACTANPSSKRNIAHGKLMSAHCVMQALKTELDRMHKAESLTHKTIKLNDHIISQQEEIDKLLEEYKRSSPDETVEDKEKLKEAANYEKKTIAKLKIKLANEGLDKIKERIDINSEEYAIGRLKVLNDFNKWSPIVRDIIYDGSHAQSVIKPATPTPG